jgi:hypothetical protein
VAGNWPFSILRGFCSSSFSFSPACLGLEETLSGDRQMARPSTWAALWDRDWGGGGPGLSLAPEGPCRRRRQTHEMGMQLKRWLTIRLVAARTLLRSESKEATRWVARAGPGTGDAAGSEGAVPQGCLVRRNPYRVQLATGIGLSRYPIRQLTSGPAGRQARSLKPGDASGHHHRTAICCARDGPGRDLRGT